MKIYRAYLRTSTNTQKEKQTIKVQKSQIEQYARDNGFQITQWYMDDGVSGSNDERPALLELLKDCKSNKEHDQTVVTVALSRIGRELRIQERIIHEFKTMNVMLRSVTEPDLGSDQMERVLLRQIVGAVAQYDKAQIVAKLHAGRKYKASKGEYAGGRLGLGYEVIDGKVVKNQDAEAVQLIFKLRRSRIRKWSYQAIADELNRLDFTNARGLKFSGQGVRGVLNAKRNRGIMSYGEANVKVEGLKI